MTDSHRRADGCVDAAPGSNRVIKAAGQEGFSV
jgi:hypothetical protein